MKRKNQVQGLGNLLLFVIFIFLTIAGCEKQKKPWEGVMPPKAEKIAKELTIHNDTRIDNYFWLNQRENPKVIKYLEDENDYLKKVMGHTEKFQDLLFDEIVSRIKQTDISVPYKHNGYYYYSRYEEGKEYPIYCRKKGDLEANEEIMLNVNDIAEGHEFCRVKSAKYLVLGSYSTLSTEMRILDANNPNGKFKIFQPREKDHEYSISHYEDKFYIVTNWNAKNFRLMETNEFQTNKENWQEVIPHRDDVLLQDIEIFKDYLVVSERAKGLNQIRVINQGTKEEHYLDFGEAAYMAYVSTNREFDTDVLRYGYTSMTTPNSTYDYNMTSKEKTLLKQQEVLGDFDVNNYQSERLYAKARDGVEVPISIVYRKGFTRNGKHPLLLYGYGSYGYSMEATFSSVRLSLLDRGFAYAIAHIRGGQEMGRWWYEDGKLLKKKNTFTDFIDCAEFLIEQDLTNSDKLFAMGGSAGGLLVGAVMNMRPDLFKGIVAGVPWVDVVTTMLDDSVPLTTSEYDEWGNPNDKEYYDYMLSYSPYDNVEEKDYPALLVTTGLHDSQVQYWEPAKWVAKLRDKKTDDNLLILHTNMKAGHGGKSGRFERYRETALEYAFMLDQLGINK
ncbi:hypothetical protein B6I21_06315 [candidate division KSB1 bacterium 4572_119]|nr:MAG: hypothetical protein B6I21_06315 [candidate division KSB1 bacterium 4572_119]